jgi:two-component sensor histidine kinase
LYQNEDYNHIFIKEYLNKIAQNLCLHTQIDVEVSVPTSYLMHIEKAQALGFIVNELITNSIKYAWSESTKIKKIKIELKVSSGDVSFLYVDNGEGYPVNYDFKKSRSLGTKLINSFVERQLIGTIEVYNNNGAVTHINFKQENVD